MANYTFDASAQGWDTSNYTWINTDGSPSLGCLAGEGVTTISVSIPVAIGDPYSFRVRVIVDEFEEDFGGIVCSLDTGDGDSIQYTFVFDGFLFDSGWNTISDLFESNVTKTTLTFSGIPADGIIATIYVDSIYIAEAPPGGYGLAHSAGGIPGAVMI